MADNDLTGLTLEQIDGIVWPDPPADATRLIRVVHSLRRKPVSSMDAEDLRVLLGQQEGLATLVPYSLNMLEKNPLTQGDFYPGDLLVVTARVPDRYWLENVESATRLKRVVEKLRKVDDIDFHFPPGNALWIRIDQLSKIGII
ncbi:contact-dependent growth inhibition system immunity protein [Nocardia brasiliensis]